MSEEQEPFETMMRKMCDSVLRHMHPHVVEAEEAAKQARAELRDRFAMTALTGLLGHFEDGIHTSDCEMISDLAYDMADAMLKARGDV